MKVGVVQMTPVKPGQPAPVLEAWASDLSQDPNVQLGVLTLLSSVPIADFKLPLAKLMAANYNPLVAVGLQVAIQRGESLPVETLLKLVGSSDQQVSKLAATSLGLSASASDIPRVEALISKDGAAAKKELDETLKLAVKQIRFRQELNAAKNPEQTREIVTKALADATLADFAWRYHCEPTVAGCAPVTNEVRDLKVKPFAENLFPKNVGHYVAIPKPGEAIQKFYETLNGMQMDSPASAVEPDPRDGQPATNAGA